MARTAPVDREREARTQKPEGDARRNRTPAEGAGSKAPGYEAADAETARAERASGSGTALRGALDVIAHDRVVGWAGDPNDATKRVKVRMWVDDVVAAETTTWNSD